MTEMGFEVVPLHSVEDGRCTCGNDNCPSPGKHPRLKNGVLGASADEDVVAGWPWVLSNLGVATGGSLLVLDFDGPQGKSLLAMLKRRFPEVPPAPLATTGRGAHLYLRVPVDLRSLIRTSVGLRPGLDTRYTRAYVVAPPSQHVTGVRYRWERPLVALDELPPISADLVTLLFGSPGPQPGAVPPLKAHRTAFLVVRYDGAVGSLVETALDRYGQMGNRHKGAVWLSLQARRLGVPEEQALEWAIQFSDRVEEPHSFPQAEAISAVRWAYRDEGIGPAPGDQTQIPAGSQKNRFGQRIDQPAERPRLETKRPLLGGWNFWWRRRGGS